MNLTSSKTDFFTQISCTKTSAFLERKPLRPSALKKGNICHLYT